MKIGINIKIDVTKLDKSKFFHGKNGAVYADLTAFVDLAVQSQHGDNGIISQAQPKEDRSAGIKMPIAGNVTKFWDDPEMAAALQALLAGQAPAQQAPPQQEPPAQDYDESIPF